MTDQTSAHDLLNGYVPAACRSTQAEELRMRDPDEYERRALESCGVHVEAMLRYLDAGAVVFDYGNNIRAQAQRAGYERAFAFPGSCRLSFDRCSVVAPDRSALRRFQEIPTTSRGATRSCSSSSPRRIARALAALARERIAFQGLPARICWLPFGGRAKAGLAFNEWCER